MASANGEAHKESIALMFPGQGSQFPGMAGDLVKTSAGAREIFDRAEALLGYSLRSIMHSDDPSELNRTVHTQPAVFVHSYALYVELRAAVDFTPAIAAGHSLGEYTALAAAGVLDFEEALDIIRVRATGMEEAQPPGTCGMAALMGMSREDALRLVSDHRGEEVLDAANFNAPDQIVVSGHVSAVARVLEAAKKLKRARAVRLPVSSAFHTALMEPARQSLAKRLENAQLRSPGFPVVSNVNGGVHTFRDGGTPLTIDQVISPVRWEDCIGTMRKAGASLFVEVGPGKVLSGLVRRMDKTARTVNVGDVEGIEAFRGALL